MAAQSTNLLGYPDKEDDPHRTITPANSDRSCSNLMMEPPQKNPYEPNEEDTHGTRDEIINDQD